MMNVSDLMISHYNYHLITNRNYQENSRKSMLLASTPLVIGLLLPLVFIVAIMTLGLFVVYLKGMDNDFNNIVIV